MWLVGNFSGVGGSRGNVWKSTQWGTMLFVGVFTKNKNCRVGLAYIFSTGFYVTVIFCLDDYWTHTSDFISAWMIIVSGPLLSTQEYFAHTWKCLYVRVKFEFKRLTPWRYTICIQCCIYENTGFPKKILTHSLMLFHANQKSTALTGAKRVQSGFPSYWHPQFWLCCIVGFFCLSFEGF